MATGSCYLIWISLLSCKCLLSRQCLWVVVRQSWNTEMITHTHTHTQAERAQVNTNFWNFTSFSLHAANGTAERRSWEWLNPAANYYLRQTPSTGSWPQTLTNSTVRRPGLCYCLINSSLMTQQQRGAELHRGHLAAVREIVSLLM